MRICLVPASRFSFTFPVKFALGLLVAFVLVVKTSAFALLGPFEAWQTPELGYNPLGTDIGAPKNLGEEYRWNVPVISR